MPTLAPVVRNSIARSTTDDTDDLFDGRRDSVSGKQYEQLLHSHGNNPAGQESVSVYVHLPFCPSRCLSCDHNTTVTHDSADIDRYLDALEREMEMVTRIIGVGRNLLQLHVGGGTPNYLSDPQLVRLITMIERHFRIVDSTETSLEASPKRTSYAQLQLLHGLGFRRINFEVRDLDPAVQTAIGRSHSPSVLQDVFHSARDVGFETTSMDLVYGLPTQSPASMYKTLATVIELNPDRIACFAYSLRPGNFAHQRAIDLTTMPSLGDKIAMFNGIVELLQSAGYSWVGLDAFAKVDDTLSLAQLEHRLHRNWIGYTLHDRADVYGFGTNAISDLSSLCVQNHLLIPDWRDAMHEGSLPIRGGIRLSNADQDRRRAMNDLMCNMELQDYTSLMNVDGQGDMLQQLNRDGLVEVSAERVSVTAHGRQVLNQRWGDASPMYRWMGIW